MKQMIAILGIGLLVASCNTNRVNEKEAALQAKQNTIDSMKIELARQHVIDSMTSVAQAKSMQEEKVTYVAAKPRKKRVIRTVPAEQSVAVANNDSYSGYSTPVATQPAVQTQQPVVYQEVPAEAKKKGWSAKAKGAVIGAGAGAVAGAIIHKRQRGLGAVVGGVLGAGAGTGIGAVIDKKNGR